MPDIRATDPSTVQRNRSTLVVGIEHLPAVFTPTSNPARSHRHADDAVAPHIP